MKSKIVFFALVGSLGASQGQTTPGVPEPGVIVYGKVYANDGVTTLAPTALKVFLKFEQDSNSNQKTFEGEVGPGAGGETYYVARIEFANPQAIGTNATVPSNQFAYPSSEESFSFEPSNQFQFPLSGSSTSTTSRAGYNTPQESAVTFVNPDGNSVSSFTYPDKDGTNTNYAGEDERGQFVRMDIQTSLEPPEDSYDEWADDYNWGPDPAVAARTADADGDGMTNETEWLFGTDPLNLASSPTELHTLVVCIESVPGQPNQKTIRFTPKFPDDVRTYSILKSTDLGQSDIFDVSTPAVAVGDGVTLITGLNFEGQTGVDVTEGVATDTAATEEKAFYQVQAEFPTD